MARPQCSDRRRVAAVESTDYKSLLLVASREENDAWGRRLRAAIELRGLDANSIAHELNVSRRTLDRTMSGERRPREWEIDRIEELLDIPRWFLEHGVERAWQLGVDGSGIVYVIAGAVEGSGNHIERLLTLREVAEWLAVSTRTVQRRWEEFDHSDPDGLPGLRIGSGRAGVRFRRAAVAAWLIRQQRPHARAR